MLCYIYEFGYNFYFFSVNLRCIFQFGIHAGANFNYLVNCFFGSSVKYKWTNLLIKPDFVLIRYMENDAKCSYDQLERMMRD